MSATAIPQTAKDKFHASASHLWATIRGIEESLKKPVVFQDSIANDEQGGGQVSLESVVRVMFSPCTFGSMDKNEIDGDNNVIPVESPSQSGRKVKRRSSRPSQTASPSPPESPMVKEDLIFDQIFSGEHIKAEEAVCHLREQLMHRKSDKSPTKHSPRSSSGKAIPKPFPVSTPAQKREISIPSLVREQSPDPPQAEQTTLPAEYSFDDGVSAISQHTLEDMARVYDSCNVSRVPSDLTQDPVDTAVESWKKCVNPRLTASSPNKKLSPLNFSRTGRSFNTQTTRNSKGARSMGTKSTMSTVTTEFASVFRKEEQKYWQEVVKGDEDPMDASPNSKVKVLKRRSTRRGRGSGETKSRLDGTIATESSTMHSSYASGYLENPSSIVVCQQRNSRDPDRLMEVLVMPPGTEMAEI